MNEQIAGIELWSIVVYFLKMAHNFDSARDGEALSSVLYKISVKQTQTKSRVNATTSPIFKNL